MGRKKKSPNKDVKRAAADKVEDNFKTASLNKDSSSNSNDNNDKKGKPVNSGEDVVSKSRTVFVATVCHVCKAVQKDATATDPGRPCVIYAQVFYNYVICIPIIFC